eukprot:jgi/Mesvir1/9553/Mv08977-RA.1
MEWQTPSPESYVEVVEGDLNSETTPMMTPAELAAFAEQVIPALPAGEEAEKLRAEREELKLKLQAAKCETAAARRKVIMANKMVAICEVCIRPFREKVRYPVKYVLAQGDHTCRPLHCNECANEIHPLYAPAGTETPNTFCKRCPICTKPLKDHAGGFVRNQELASFIFEHTNVEVCKFCEDTYPWGEDLEHERVCPRGLDYHCGNVMEFTRPDNSKGRAGCLHVSKSSTDANSHDALCEFNGFVIPRPALKIVERSTRAPASSEEYATFLLSRDAAELSPGMREFKNAAEMLMSEGPDVIKTACKKVVSGLLKEGGLSADKWSDAKLKAMVEAFKQELTAAAKGKSTVAGPSTAGTGHLRASGGGRRRQGRGTSARDAIDVEEDFDPAQIAEAARLSLQCN